MAHCRHRGSSASLCLLIDFHIGDLHQERHGGSTLRLVRRFPPPWTLEALDGGGFKVVDSHGQSLAYVYGHFDPHDAETAKGLTLDEARRIASNIAKLPSLLLRRA